MTGDTRQDEHPVRNAAYWRTRPMSERIAAVETLRCEWLALNDSTALNRPMEKVLRVVRRHRTAV